MKRDVPEIKINPITLEYEPMPEKPKSRFGIEKYIWDRARAKKQNVTNYYHALIQSIRTGPCYKGQELAVQEPEEFGVGTSTFSPDVLKLYKTGPEYNEVKSAQWRRGEIQCAKNQLLRYYKLLMERLELGDELPAVNYVFLRYGTYKDYELHHCDKEGKNQGNGNHRCDNKCLTKNLTSKKLEVSVIPLNLLLAIFSLSRFHRIKEMDHTTSTGRNQESYILLARKVFSAFQGHSRKPPIKNLEELLQDSVNPELKQILMIDKLKIKRSNSPEDFTCSPLGLNTDYKISQFPIVRFEMNKNAEKQWLDNFHRYNGELLYRCAGEIQEEFAEDF